MVSIRHPPQRSPVPTLSQALRNQLWTLCKVCLGKALSLSLSLFPPTDNGAITALTLAPRVLSPSLPC